MTGRSQGISGQCKLTLDIYRGEILLRTSFISVMQEFFLHNASLLNVNFTL